MSEKKQVRMVFIFEIHLLHGMGGVGAGNIMGACSWIGFFLGREGGKVTDGMRCGREGHGRAGMKRHKLTEGDGYGHL